MAQGVFCLLSIINRDFSRVFSLSVFFFDVRFLFNVLNVRFLRLQDIDLLFWSSHAEETVKLLAAHLRFERYLFRTVAFHHFFFFLAHLFTLPLFSLSFSLSRCRDYPLF